MDINSYKFETDQFGISDTGLHLLRSRFNYETIEFSQVDEIALDKGRQVRNWFLALMIGLILLFSGGYGLIKFFYEFFFGNDFHIFHVEQCLLPLVLFSFGGYAIYSALKIGFVLKIKTDGKTRSFPIEQLKKKSQIGSLVHYFKDNSLTKHKISVNFERPFASD